MKAKIKEYCSSSPWLPRREQNPRCTLTEASRVSSGVSSSGKVSSLSDIKTMVCLSCQSACTSAVDEKTKNAKLKKRRKVKAEAKQIHEDYCFHCGDGGELVMCDKKDCPKAYHLLCLNLTQPPYGKWECPWHRCDECGSAAVSFCEFCPHSFCKAHGKGALVPSALEGRLCCSNHDPESPVSPEHWSKIRCKWESQECGEEVKE